MKTRMAPGVVRRRPAALLVVVLVLAMMLLLFSTAVQEAHAETKDPDEEILGNDDEDDIQEIFAPQCDPECDSKHYCNFLGKCEPYPILILECSAGSSCEACHCSGKCVDGICRT